MNEFIKVLLSLSVSGALLLLLILGLKPLYKNKFSKRWQYYIWIVVALRFLLPFTPDTTIVGSLFEKFGTAAITNEISTSPNVPVPAGTGDNKAEPIQTNREINAAAMREPFNNYVCLFFIWSALALILFVRKITVYQGFIQYIKAGNKELSDIKILNLLSDCEEKLNIKARVELSCNPLIASPMLIGFFRPRIILPIGELEDKELSYIFVHELTHYKQRDMFYKWLIQIAVCVHWFNPFIYLLEKEVNKSCELSCDEKVISVLDDTARREYGDTLISFLKSNNLYKSSLASVTLTEGAEQLKERLGAIMKFKKKSKTVVAVTAIFSVAVCVCFLGTGAYAVPSVNDGNKMIWKDSRILNDVLTEDGIYYIFCDGAGEDDKPLASVSVGDIMFVLVRKDSYTSIGPFAHSETLMEDVAKQCEPMKSLTQEEKELVIKTAAGVLESSEHSASYEKLIACKTENYLQQSIADFNGTLASTPDELTEFLAAVADVSGTISHDDENYDFLDTTICFSSQELYCGHMGEQVAFLASISKQSRPSEWLDEDGEIWYEFNCFANLYVDYSISSPEHITVAERDNMLLTFKEEMQNYLNGLSEAEIKQSNIETILMDKAAELENSLSTENMKLLSCEISVDIIG